MKFRYILASAILGSMAFSSCNELNELKPQQSIETEISFATTQDIDLHINGVYNDLQNDDLLGGNNLLLADLLVSDDVDWTGSFTTFADVDSKTMTANNGIMSGMWIAAYRAINHMNTVIARVDAAEASLNFSGDREEYNMKVKSEMRALRAIVHYEIARYFTETPWDATPGAANAGPAVPIVRDADVVFVPEDIKPVGRNTLNEVYQFIEAELAQSVTEGVAGRISRGLSDDAIKVYQMRIAMQKKDWPRVETLATEIAGGSYALGETLEMFENNDGGASESIFEILHSSVDNPGVNGGLSTFYNRRARNDISVTTAFVGLFPALQSQGTSAVLLEDSMKPVAGPDDDETDQKFQQGLTIIDKRQTELLYLEGRSRNSEKYEDAVNAADDVPIARLAEVLLSLAEAQVEQGKYVEAIANINAIRVRSREIQNEKDLKVVVSDAAVSYTQADFDDGAGNIDPALLTAALRLERRVELAFEGHRYHDLLRYRDDNGPLPLPTNADGEPTGTAYAFPIPQRELDVNDLLKQNRQYN